MGQPIKEPKGTLSLYVKAMRPEKLGDEAYSAINHAWVQDRVQVAETHCTLSEAEKIAEIHRKINGVLNVVATWEGSVTL